MVASEIGRDKLRESDTAYWLILKNKMVTPILFNRLDALALSIIHPPHAYSTIFPTLDFTYQLKIIKKKDVGRSGFPKQIIIAPATQGV